LRGLRPLWALSEGGTHEEQSHRRGSNSHTVDHIPALSFPTDGQSTLFEFAKVAYSGGAEAEFGFFAVFANGADYQIVVGFEHRLFRLRFR
jgi:hypothetical protein